MPLRREDVVDAGLAELDKVGLDRLTTRNVAQRLGVRVGALYWHVASKRDLLKAMADRISEEIRDGVLPCGGWPEQLLGFARLARRAMLAHRDGARLLIGALPTRSQVESADRLFKILLSAGMREEQAVLVMDTVMSYVTGFVLQEQSLEAAAGVNAAIAAGGLAEELPQYVERFIAAGNRHSVDEKFDLELRLVIDGWRATLASPDATRPSADAAHASGTGDSEALPPAS